MAYIFDPDVLHDIVKSSIGLPLDQSFDAITAGLAERYPGHIDTGERKWILNNAGGAMGQITLLHASLSEYILLFGTPIGTEGHSGRYSTDVYDFMIEGEMWCYVEGELERGVYLPGDKAFLGKAKAKGYRAKPGTWMLEYSRGAVFTMLPFGLADTLTSTLDFKTFLRTFSRYGTMVTKELVSGKV
jgi:C-8 sterol isomerase